MSSVAAHRENETYFENSTRDLRWIPDTIQSTESFAQYIFNMSGPLHIRREKMDLDRGSGVELFCNDHKTRAETSLIGGGCALPPYFTTLVMDPFRLESHFIWRT